MAAVSGHHVPGTDFNWRHGYHPLNEATALKYRKKWLGGKSGGRKKSGVHRVTNPEGTPHYVIGPAGEKFANASKSRKYWTVEHDISGHEDVISSAPKALQNVWNQAREKGWSASLFVPQRSQGHRELHSLQLVSPDGKINHKLDWADGKRTTYGNPTSTRKALADINTYEPSKQMDDKIRTAVRKNDVPAAPQSKEDRALAEARAKEAEAAARRKRTVELYEQAQARQKEAADAVAKERQAEEERARKAAAEQKARVERASELSSQAARAYKAGDYETALRLLDEASSSDPDRTRLFQARKNKVLEKQGEARYHKSALAKKPTVPMGRKS